jgi:hypothetical protein
VAVAEVKNYGLSGVHRTLQLGKQGPVLVGNADTDSFTVTLQDAATLTTMGGANATDTAHFITKAQLDVVYTEAQFLANVNYNDTSPILLGNISSGTKTIITTFDVTTAFDANAVVTVGDSTNNSLLMSDDYAEIEVTGTYQTINTVEFASNTALNIYVTQGGATQGAGTILVSVVDGPVVNSGVINYDTGGNSVNTGNFIFTDDVLTINTNGTSDLKLQSPDDLYLDALDDDIFVRANDDIRLRTGYNFGDDTYAWELRYDNNGTVTFYNPNEDNNYGTIQAINNAGALGISFEGNDDAYIKSSYGDHTWKFGSNGDLTLPAGGDIKDSAGISVLGVGGISLANISVTSNSPSGNGSLSYDNTTGVFTFTPANLSSVAGNYGNSNVVTLLSSFGSNTIVTTGNISAGNVITTGTALTGISAIVAGVTNTLLPNTVASFSANVNNYTQVTLQNKSSGADATADFVITANNGSDTVNFADFGIINSGYDNTTPTNSLGNIVFAADTYLYAQGNSSSVSQSGGNLAIGATTIGKTVKVFAGGANSNSIVGTFSNTGLAVTGTVSGTGNISTSGKFVGDGSSLTNVTVSVAGNITGTSQNVSLVAGSFTATFDNTGRLVLPSMGGDEGGEINLGIPATNTTLSTRVVVDVFQDRLRFFDGNTKGAYIDLSQAGTGVSTLLNNRVSGLVNAGTFVTMDLIKATVTTSGNRGLSLAATTGSFAINIGGTYATTTPSSGGSAGTLTVTTTASASVFNWGFFNQGDTATYILTDTTNSRAYRITLQIGAGYNNNMISIERLI